MKTLGTFNFVYLTIVLSLFTLQCNLLFLQITLIFFVTFLVEIAIQQFYADRSKSKSDTGRNSSLLDK
jgi:hypothetical protein